MDYASIIALSAKKVGVSASLLLAICTQESGLKNINNEFDRGTPSIGICQLKKTTAEFLGFKGGRTALQDPKVNSYWAAKYLKWQLDRYNGDACRATAAYNAGSYIESKKKPGYPKNLKYVKKVKSLILEDKVAMLLVCNQFEPMFAGGF